MPPGHRFEHVRQKYSVAPIGVNAVLAEAGAPVCAEHLAMPPLVLATSMRIHDSLEDGVSFYMAELMRLKQIVDLARNAKPSDNRSLLYLLDEILLGTNSKERHIAVVRVLHYLVQHASDRRNFDPRSGPGCRRTAVRRLPLRAFSRDTARPAGRISHDVRLHIASRHCDHDQRPETAGNRGFGRQ